MSNSNISRIINYFQEYNSFWSAWIISLAIVIILAIFFNLININKKIAPNYPSFRNNLIGQNQNQLLNYFSITIFSLFICTYIYLIFKDAEFAYHDNGQFTFFSLQGNFFGMPIWAGAGRYWPLGLQEYNLISLFSKTPLAYHSFSIIQLLITIFICLSILSSINLILRLFIITIILITPSFVISFYGLIFPERNLIFFLAIFIFCVIRNQDNNSLFYLCGAFISTQFLLYYKEPSFLLILGFAITRLIIKFLNSPIWQGKQVKYISTFIKENWLEFGLVILSLVFVYLFVSNTVGKVETSYADERQGVNPFSTLISYLKINPVLSIFIIFFCFRLVNIFRKKQSIDLIWDSLAIGNLLYFLAYLKLNMFRWYYTAPIDFITVLYLSKMIANLNIFVNTNKHNYQRLILLSLLMLIFLQNLHYSSYAILSQKKEIDSRVQVANFLRNYLDNNQQKNRINLFFPELSGYYIQEFASFLNYKNFAILIADNHNINQQKQKNSETYLIMQSNELFIDNLCVTFRPFQCFNINEPLKDDLIVFIPSTSSMLFSPKLDEYAPLEKLKNYDQNSVRIFHYQPDFKGIEYILYLFCKNAINEQWFNAYIFTDYHTDNL